MSTRTQFTAKDIENLGPAKTADVINELMEALRQAQQSFADVVATLSGSKVES